MGYEEALKKAWVDLANLRLANNLSVKFLADNYSVDVVNRTIILVSDCAAVKDFVSILVLHYLARRIKGLPALSGQWLTFRQLSGIEGYADTFHRRCAEPLIRKYGSNPEALKEVLGRLPGKLSEGPDIGIIIDAFVNVPVLIKLWKQDAEFAPDAKIFFDANIKNIFCTEDIVVLAQIVASRL